MAKPIKYSGPKPWITILSGEFVLIALAVYLVVGLAQGYAREGLLLILLLFFAGLLTLWAAGLVKAVAFASGKGRDDFAAPNRLSLVTPPTLVALGWIAAFTTSGILTGEAANWWFLLISYFVYIIVACVGCTVSPDILDAVLVKVTPGILKSASIVLGTFIVNSLLVAGFFLWEDRIDITDMLFY